MMTKTSSLTNTLLRQLTLIPLLALTVLIFSTKSVAQNNNNVQKIIENNVPSTQEGVSQELLNEYAEIVNKIRDEKGFIDLRTLKEVEKTRLETIFLAMSKAQKEKQPVFFLRSPLPSPRIVPTEERMEAWKDSKIFGIWINEKRVSNSDLEKYKNTDFAHVFVSKPAKISKNYSNHYYLVNLMTNEHYKAYYKQKTANNDKYSIGLYLPTTLSYKITDTTTLSPIAGGVKKIFDLNKDALVYIDKKETNMDAARKINPNEITVFNFWEGGNAINRFGYRGKNGVVEITTRK